MTPVALITGGGSGIGAATARRLARDGWSVCVSGRRREPLQRVADEVGGLAVAADTTRSEQIESAVAAAVQRFGCLDALVTCAGAGAPGAAGDQTLDRWNAVVATNLTGTFLACRAALPHLLATGGAIVTVASVAGLRAGPAAAAYSASKAGAIMLTQSIAVDYGPRGVRANCVCPGWIRTAIGDGEMDDLAARRSVDREQAYAIATASVPARRAGRVEEAAEAVVWLAGPASSYVNGAVLTVDGGGAAVDVATLAFGYPTEAAT